MRCTIVLLSMLLAGLSPAQSLEEKRDAKLAEEWLQLAPWITDYDAALKEARRSGRLIFAYFTRSYAY